MGEKYTFADLKFFAAEAMIDRTYQKWNQGKKIGNFDKMLFYFGRILRETTFYSLHPALETPDREKRIKSSLEMLKGIR